MEAAVFDLDGTLADSMSRFSSGLFTVLDRNGIEYDTEELIRITTPLGYRDTARYFISMGAPGTEEEIVNNMLACVKREYAENIPLKPYAKDYLERLSARGVRLFVLTASPHVLTDPCLVRTGVYGLFEKVWCSDDFGIKKSDARLYRQVAWQIGARPAEIYFFDDNPIAVKAAAEAGLFTVGVKDCQPSSDIEALRRTADMYIETFRDMP